MKIAIYQINGKRDIHGVMFVNYTNLSRYQDTLDIDSRIYDKVFEGEIDCKDLDLEGVYAMFNLHQPKNYRGRSLSVSDVVEIFDTDNGQSTFWFCDIIGFKRVNFNPELCLNEAGN